MLTERQKIIYDLWNKIGSEKEVSKDLDISISSLRKNLYFIARKGYNITKDNYCEQAPPGWIMKSSTIQSDGVGNIKQRWDRIIPNDDQNDLFEYLNSRIPNNILLDIPNHFNYDEKVQLEWTLADYHFGLLSWGEETGEDFNIDIAKNLLKEVSKDIFSRSGYVNETVLVLMGDNFHTDFFSNKTEQHHHSLDVDGRYPKMIKSGVETFISAIEICLQFSNRVKVIVLYGNHDKQTSSVLPFILHAWFRNENRVEIDLSPAKQHYNVWGKTATVYHHGNSIKPDRLCGDFLRHLILNNTPDIQYLYAKQAHLHQELIRDINGVTFEIVPSLTARDHFTASSGFCSKRATVATKYHKDYGEIDRYSITPRALEMKKALI